MVINPDEITGNSIKTAIKKKGQALGFYDIRVGPPLDLTDRLNDWLSKGYHGTMDWLARNPEVRASAKEMWPEVQSIIAVGLNYGPDDNPLPEMDDKSSGYISVYARGDDYHDVLKKKLKELGRWLAQTYDCELKVFVDTAPVMEKPHAHGAGLGWQGKHTNLVSRTHGSYLFLGIIYTTLKLPFDETETDHCGTCRKCLDICPTNAFPQPYVLDARRCISYLTIEHKGPIPVEFRKAIGNRIYGCDDCLAVCPWNKFATEAAEIKFRHRAGLQSPRLKDLAQLTDESFRDLFKKSPVKRIGRDRFVSNVLIAIGNSNDPTLLAVAQNLTQDQNDTVAEAAQWAVKELSM